MTRARDWNGYTPRPAKPADHVEVSVTMFTERAMGEIELPGDDAGWATARSPFGRICCWLENPRAVAS